jgi:replicative DNA helicase
MNQSEQRLGALLSDRTLPQSLEAEKAVLSCLLLDPSSTMDLVFSKIKHESYLYSAAHRKILSGLKTMRESMMPNVIDLITTIDWFERQHLIEEVGGEEYFHYLLNVVPTTANVEKYIQTIQDTYILRSLIATCTDIIDRCYQSQGEVQDLIDTIEKQILDITEKTIETHAKSVRELMKGTINYLEDLSRRKPEIIGLSTGYDIDKKITGLKRGELNVLAARPSMGKTALALDICRNIALRDNKAVGIFSLEMGSYQLVLRLLCSEAQIDIKDIRDGKLTNQQWANEIMGTANRLRTAPIYIDETPQLSTLEIRQKARRMKQNCDIQLIIIDYLQLIRPVGSGRNTTREQEVAKITGDIKSLAKELNIPILLLCQLNRQAEQGDLPKLSHLRESGAIEQDADIVMLLHRKREDEYKFSNSLDDKEKFNNEEDDSMQDNDGKLKSLIIVAKNRNGETGIVPLAFKPEWTRFFNASTIADVDVPTKVNF